MLDWIKPGKILAWVTLCHQPLKLEPFTKGFFSRLAIYDSRWGGKDNR